MLIDMHAHTNQLSPCSRLSPEDAILGAKQKGLDGICFTDHDVMWDHERIADLREKYDFLVFRGIEITTNYGHILVYGLEDWDRNGHDRRGFAPYFPLVELKEMVERTGAFMVVTHPFREPGYVQKGYGHCQLTIALEDVLHRPIFRMVDALEGFNGQSCPEENHVSSRVAQALNLPALGGSDAHSKKEVGSGATLFSKRFSQETELLWMLKNGYFTVKMPESFRDPFSFSGSANPAWP